MCIHRRQFLFFAFSLLSVMLISSCSSPSAGGAPAGPVQLRLGVSLTPQELATYQVAIKTLDDQHPEWEIILENTPQSGIIETITAQLAGNDLPDVVRLQGLMAQQWIRQSAFMDLNSRIETSAMDLYDFYPGPLEQFVWQDHYFGLPDTAAPDVVFYNKDLFDQAGLPYPTDEWTYPQMRDAAILLTRDSSGRNPTHPAFDPGRIEVWGWNGGLTFFWQRHLVQAFGADFCKNPDCTQMNFTDPAVLDAVDWWASLVSQDHAALYDPFGGSQTGIPGDPFLSGNAAMGYNGYFAVGQLNQSGNFNYDIVQPFVALDGKRYTPLSTNGYVISAASEHPDEAWNLVSALLDAEFLSTTWGKPGHSVPARRSVAASAVNLDHPPANQQAILEAMEYGVVFKPYTASAFEVYARTTDLFVQAMKGDLPVEEAMRQAEQAANEILARDR